MKTDTTSKNITSLVKYRPNECVILGAKINV